MSRKAIVAGLGILGALVMGAKSPTAPATGPADPLARRIVERLQNDRDRVLRHRYVESVLLERLARDGTVRSRTVEVYEVLTHGGRRLRRALSLDPAQDSRGFSMVRQQESGLLRPASGAAEPAGTAPGDGFDLEALAGCFRLYPLGRDSLDGREAVRVAFTAIDGCVGRDTRALRLLGNLAGTLWLDAADFDVLRVRGYLQRPVTFGLGILGRVERFDLELDRERLDSGFYATSRIVYRARGSSFMLNRFDLRSSRRRGAFVREAADQPARAELSPVEAKGPAATPR